MTYPAPDFLSDDPWFGPAPDTLASLRMKALLQEERLLAAVSKPSGVPHPRREPENIHQQMYEMATVNIATTLSLNPISFGGGSEGVHEGWASGVGR